MPFPTTPILDDFNRAAGSLDTRLGCSNGVNSWFLGQINGGTTTDCDVGSSQLRVSGSTGDSFITASFGPDAEVYASWPVAPTSYAFLAARIKDENTATWDGYGVIWIAGGTGWQIRRYDNGASTVLASSASPNVVAGDKVGMSVVGSLITAYRYNAGAWASVVSFSDATYPLAGKIGFEFGDSTGRMTDFGGGTYVPAAGLTPNPFIQRHSRGTSW